MKSGERPRTLCDIRITRCDGDYSDHGTKSSRCRSEP